MKHAIPLKQFVAEADEIVRELGERNEAVVIMRGKRPCAIVVPFDSEEPDDHVLTEDELRDAILKADSEVAAGEFVPLEPARKLVRKVWAAR